MLTALTFVLVLIAVVSLLAGAIASAKGFGFGRFLGRYRI